jgi:hypothetical protein
MLKLSHPLAQAVTPPCSSCHTTMLKLSHHHAFLKPFNRISTPKDKDYHTALLVKTFI